MNKFAPCPQCGSAAAERMKFTWWGGVLGPKLLTHVKCPNCRSTFNGKTGKDNTTNIVIYSVVAVVAAFVLLFAVFFVIGFVAYFAKMQ